MNELQTDYSKLLLAEIMKMNHLLQAMQPVPPSQWSEQDKRTAKQVKLNSMSLGEVYAQDIQTQRYKEREAKKQAQKRALERHRNAIRVAASNDFE